MIEPVGKKELGVPKESRVVLAVAPDIMSERKEGKWVMQLAQKMKNEKVVFVLIGKETK